MKTIKGNLIMENDMTFEEDLKVEGHIIGENGIRYNLIVKGNLNCWDLNCLNLNCLNLNCLNLNCRNLNCWDLNCLNLNCWDLNCLDLNCWNLNCWNLNCWDLDCRDCSYYAVAFAYNDIKCKSIKGRRKNSKHFVLDGEIEIIEDKTPKEIMHEGKKYRLVEDE